MNRAILAIKIRYKLSHLTSYIEISGLSNLYDTHIISEYFFKDFLNLLYGYSLEDINTSQKNNIATDLIDNYNKVSIQVTAETSLEKVKDTILKFERERLYEKFSKLILLILVNKKIKHTSSIITNGKYKFERLDISDITNYILQTDINKQEKIVNFLEKELILDNKDQIFSQEMDILIELLQLIDSENNKIQNIEIEDEPRPDFKIEERFSHHTDFLKDLYIELKSIYGATLKKLKEDLAFDILKTKKISVYLKRLSDDFLKKANGNPEKALNDLVEYFKEQLKAKGITPVENAIWFFLVDEIYRCNVFPNPKV
jgi:hypothetical protein